MIELLQNKNSATRFQIMVELAASGPKVHQRGIAARLDISPQAVSDYLQQLIEEGLIEASGRSAYTVSMKGVNWMLKMLRELRDYTGAAARAVTNITVCAAVAESDLAQGQAVKLKMKDGLLYASPAGKGGARGIAVTDARPGEDIAISNVEGLVELKRGKVTILEVPTVQEGGSRQVNLKKLKTRLSRDRHIGAIGIEALAAARRAGIEPDYLFGVTETAIEGARCGLSYTIMCTTDATPALVKKLQENDLDYKIVSLAAKA